MQRQFPFNPHFWLLPLAIALLLAGATLTHAGTQTDPPETPSAVYVIAVGINEYSAPWVKLHTAVADAQATAAAFQKAWVGHASRVDVQLLTDRQVSCTSVQQALDHAASHASINDLFVFYYAGISQTSNGEYYLATSNTDPDHPERNAIPATLLKACFAKIQARKQLVVLDTRGSHDKMETFLDRTTDASTTAQQLLDVKSVLLTSEGEALDEKPDTHGHGVLTYAFLQGLSGEAAIVPTYSNITARELEAYLPVPVMKLTDGEQVFRSYSWGDDFPVVPVSSAMKPTPAMRQTQLDDAPPPIPAPPVPSKGQDYAVIFATDHYDEFNSLTNPISDAQAIADELKNRYGFQVELVKNPKREDILRTLRTYRQRHYDPGDQLFVFFAGHGLKGDQDSYIVPSDAKQQDPDYDSYLQYAVLRNELLMFPCQHILLGLDVCYGGDFAGPKTQALVPPTLPLASFFHLAADDASVDTPTYVPVSTPAFIMRLMKDRTRLFLSSAGDVPVPDGDPGYHSPFASQLLKTLREGEMKPVITAHNLYESVLRTQTEPQLEVFDNTNPGGDFVFVPTGTSRSLK